jgi:hypothetical protein
VSSRGAIDPDARAYIAALTGTYSQTELDAIDAFFLALKAASIYTYDRIFLLCADVVADVRIDMASATTVGINNGMTFTARQGLTGNGSSAYFDTGFNPATAGGNYTQNSASMSVYGRTNNAIVGYDMGAQNSSTSRRAAITSRWSDNNQYSMINVNPPNNTLSASPGSTQLWTISRTASNLQTAYRGATSQATQTGTSTLVPNQNIWVGALNSGGVINAPTNRQYPLAMIGAGRSGSQMSDLDTAVTNLLTAFGANV